MPTISIFYGIAIRTYFKDLAPPHFHALYSGYEAPFDISTGEIIKGTMPPVSVRLVKEWCERHRAELLENWRRRERGVVLERIPGLGAEQSD